jgi:hypothetical protein
MMNIYHKSFNRDPNIDIAIKNAFENYVNQNEKTATNLVFYLDKVIQIFRYLLDKDIFEGFYKNSLAKRLLDQKSANEDAEKMFILKMKEECGF